MQRLVLGFTAVLLGAISTPARAADVSVQLDAASGFSVKNATGAIERLRVDEATGNVSRNGALFVHTSGVQSLFVGQSTGSTASTGSGNVGVGPFALDANTTGFSNTAVGQSALTDNSTGIANSAFGAASLLHNTTGGSNSAFGLAALFSNTTGSNNAAIGVYALRLNSTGSSNAAVGANALMGNTDGYWNSAVGDSALRSNTTAPQNSAFGKSALRATTTGAGNSAVGSYALRDNTTGGSNVGFGQTALRFNTTGNDNAALGRGALYTNTAGSRNVALGSNAGSGQTTGNDNIYLASAGVAGESGRIRIGTAGTHTQTQVAGIHGATSGGGIGVLVNASGVLGTTTSSARFKRDVEDLGEASELLMRLRPVRFHYLEEAVGAEEAKLEQYGLIAEEVATVAPELVAPDADGKPYSVKYHVLPALLVNELQKEHRANAEQQRTIDAQRELIASLSARLAALETRAGK